MTEVSFTINGLKYQVIDLLSNKVEVINVNDKEINEIIIPSNISYDSKVYKVAKLGDNLFSENHIITKITTPSSIEIIGFKTCYCATKLETIVIPIDSNILRFENQCFDGCYSLKSINLPPKLQFIGFYSLCGSPITSVHIPKTVIQINNGAFSLSDIVNFTVEEGNPNYIVYNGSLYSKDMRRFIAANLASDIWIKDSVDVILDGALSMKRIQRVHLPYMLRSLGIIDFGLHEAKRIDFIYCGLRKFKSLNVINSANMQIRLITASFSPFKDNFGIKSVGSVESIEFCTIDVMINPFPTCCRRRKLRSVCFMLCSVFSIV